MSEGSSEPPGLDDLRRRLYGPDASAEDVARFEAARVEPDAASDPPDAPRPPRRGRRAAFSGAVLAGAVLAVAIALAVGAVLGRPTARPTASASASPSPTIVEGQLPVAAGARAVFVSALASGAKAGLLDSLSAHPNLLPPELRTVGRADSIEYSGDGPTTLALSPSALAERGGRATVILVLARTGAYAWRATRVAVRADHSGPEPVVASFGGATEAGAPVTATFGYDRGAPSRLAVRVAGGTRWGAVVVFTD